MSAQPKRVAFYRPRFLSVPARLANRFGLITPVQVIEGAARDIRDNVRRNLDNHFSGENSPELGSRELEINQAAENTLPPNNNNNIIEVDGLDVNRTSVERVAVRRNYSPVSYDSSIFEANNEENMQRNPLPSTVPPENVDREIERLRAQARNNAAADYEDAGHPLEDPSNALIIEIVQTVREMREEIRELHEQIHDLRANREDLNRTRTIPNDTNLDVTYGRTLNDVRNQSAPLNGHLRLKEARDMIPEFDGNSQAKLKEFLSACSYAIKNINPADEKTLLEAILCTKLKGKAMVDFETRNINSFGQFKRELEICYLSKKSITHLQIEFNSLKQKAGESARAYGLRADNLAMELYESMIEGQDYGSERKRIILETIQQQALQNFQIGLHDDIKLVVRAQHYSTLQEAIAGANAEEKVKGPLEHASRHKPDYTISQAARNKVSQCHKCGKLGHHGRECRTSRYSNRFSLPKPQGPSRINILEKHCTYCKKSGHGRDECWSLHGRPGIVQSNRTKSNEDKKPQNRNNTNGQRRKNKTQNEDEEEDEENTRQPRPALEYQISQVTGKSQTKTGLDLVTLPIQEVKKGKLNLLFDTGATVTLMKLRNLKGETMIYEEQMALTGVTGHKMNTIGKIKATIILKNRKIRHSIYIVKDDFPIDYEGILGVDFLQKHKVTCDYNKKQIQLSDTILKLYPYRALILKPRSETIIQATTDSNKVGIIRAEETQPGVFIGYCLVKPEEFSCPISVINTTEEYIKLPTPCVTVEEIKNTAAQICITQAQQEATTLSRREQIKNLLRIQHLNQEEVKTLLEICEGFSDIFYIEGDALTYTPTITHEITVQANSAPVNIRPYRLPEKHKQEVNQQVKGMLRDKIIRPSTSQWNAPLLVVPKKTDASGKQKLRIVVDFRKLNDLTIGDSFPLPNITDILDQLGNAKYFTTLDLASGYHQIPVSENDKCKTAFSTPYGHYEFNRMPFGLKNAPATFQRLMNSVLTGLQGIKCLVYLDDIVIYGASLKEHNTRLIEVLNKLRKHNLKLQPDKCEFLRKEVIYLGHIVTENGIMPDPSKLKAVREFPTPTKVKEIQSFIGLAGYYRKFIENFSKIAKPLTKLTKKGEKFEWVGEQQNAFETLKNKLITAPVLKYPDFSQEFLLTTDASDYAIGAILSQGEVGQDRPIAYASRILSRAEHNYNTTEKELLAIVWAVKYYRPYLYGTKFKIITDHKPLVWLFNVADPGSRLIRWRLKLEEYDYEIVHRSGKTNTNADALSRNVVLNLKEEKEENYNERRDYSEEDKARILYEYHDAPLGGHQGIERTINRIRMKHNWSGLTKYVENYIAKCEFCQKNKLKRKSKAPLVITDTASRPFEKCALDIVGPLTVTNNGNKYVLTFQDNLTKFSKAVPLPNQEAATVAKEFVVKIIFEHGIPDKVLTDQGTNFLSDMFKNMCKLLKIEKIQTTAYHPESNGALERSHRTLAEYLRHYINADQTDWDEWIPYAMFTYNTTPHTATGFTPFELVYGHQAILPTALTTPPKPTYTYDNYAQELKERIRATNQIAKEHIREEKIKVKEQYDKRAKQTTFKVGDKILLHDETVRRGRSKKLDSLWIGPYIITDKISDVNYKIKVGRKIICTHVNRLKAFIEH